MRITIPDFARARVMVYGDVMLDRYWYGKTSRISPEAPVPIVHVKSTEECPGGAGNVALNLKKLGVDVKLFAACGNDEAAKILAQHFIEHQVDCYLTAVDTIPTTTKLRVLSANQQLIRLDFEEKLTEFEQNDLLTHCYDKLPHHDVLILSDYDKGCLAEPWRLITAAKAEKVKVIIDPKQLDFSAYREAYLVTPNFKEFCAVVGDCSDEHSIVEKGLHLINTHAMQALLVTRGEQGMTLIQANGDVMTLPAYAREVFDVTGAGDTVISTLAAAVAAGETLESAMRLANIAASLVVGKLGAASVSVKELRQAIEAQHTNGVELHDIGVVSHPILREAVTDAKKHGETIVVLPGIFDVLLDGQLRLLEQAKQRGDRLIIIVMDDDFAQHAGYQPVHSMAARQSALAGIALVDWVVDSNESSMTTLCQHIVPDQLVATPTTKTLIQPLLSLPGVEIVHSEIDELKEYQRLKHKIEQKKTIMV